MKMTSVLLLALTAVFPACASTWTSGIQAGDQTVSYVVDLGRAHTQYVDIEMTFPAGGKDVCEVLLPTWRPGRYTILDPAGTVFQVRATDELGQSLPISKSAKSAWRIETRAARDVVLRYSVYANSLYDRTRHVDPTHAFLSGSSVFFYTPPLRHAPVRVEVRAPEDWLIATGLEFAPGETRVLTAQNYDVLVDSPLEIGLHERLQFEVEGVPHEVAIWPTGLEYDAAHLIEDLSKIVAAQAQIFGRMPYSRYVFLVHAKQGAGGTEHLNSTIMQTSREALEASVKRSKAYEGFLSLASHEMFHTWNVKQLRPAGIHPYDYQKENHTDLLWVAEGTTSYYGGLTLARTGQRPVKKYLDGLGEAGNSLRRLPAARVTSVAEASWNTWISPSDANGPNTRVDYYGKGSLTSLCLDMELRRRSGGAASLDTVLRTLFERHPLSGSGYTTQDLLRALEESAGSSFEEFFAKYVSGTEPLPFEEVMETVGLEFVFVPEKDATAEESSDASETAEAEGEAEEAPAEGVADSASNSEPEEIPIVPYLGLRLRSGGSGSVIRNLLADGPAYDSGLLVGDEILTLEGRRLRPEDLDDRLEDFEPGQTVTIHFLRDDELMSLAVELSGVPKGKFELRRLKETTEAQRAAYASWIGQAWPAEK